MRSKQWTSARFSPNIPCLARLWASTPIALAMGGSAALGQTYILEKDGELYESRVSWFRELNGLDTTMGYEGNTPADLTQAAGRLIHMDEKLRCFGCHATNAVQGKQLTLDKIT